MFRSGYLAERGELEDHDLVALPRYQADVGSDWEGNEAASTAGPTGRWARTDVD